MNRVGKLALLAVGVGALAIVAIGVGKLIGRPRNAPLDEAFQLLASGVAPGGLEEARELSVPGFQDGEKLLALSLSDDSAMLAVSTKHRLLCFHVDSTRWVEWPLPRPIENASALHVDSTTGKVHAVVGDDGRLLTGDCRASGAVLESAESVTANQPAVAWLDADDSRVWVAPANPTGAEVKISAHPLPGASSEPVEMSVVFPGEANPLFPNAAVIHAMAKVADNILLFYGDANLFHDADLRDESVLVIAVDEPDRRTNRLVFAAHAEEEDSGKTRWVATHVRRLLPASVPGRVYVLTEGPPGVAVLGSDAKPIEVHADTLFSTDYRDGRETYDLRVKSTGKNASMEVGRRGTDARFNYELPWKSAQEPRFAAISREGRRVVVADEGGGLLLVDLAKAPAR